MSAAKYENFLKYDYEAFVKSSETHFKHAKEIYEFAIKNEVEQFNPRYSLNDLRVEYVRMSGHGVWVSILLITEALFIKRGITYDSSNVKHYYQALSKLGMSKELRMFKDLYDKFHLKMGYDGRVIPVEALKSFGDAKRYISRIKNLL